VANTIAITKEKNNAVRVTFGDDLPGLKRIKAGGKIPAEYLHAILNFHVQHQDPKGKISSQHVQRMKAYW